MAARGRCVYLWLAAKACGKNRRSHKLRPYVVKVAKLCVKREAGKLGARRVKYWREVQNFVCEVEIAEYCEEKLEVNRT